MINRSRATVLFMAILSVAVVLISNPCWAAPSIGSLAPVNPKYLEYVEMKQSLGASTNEKAPGGPGDTKYSLGHMPSPLDMSHLFRKDNFPGGLKNSANYPPSYDLRDNDGITEVKNQNPFGTCWTSATFASIESYLKPEKSSSFSEYHLAYSAYSGPNSFTTHVDSGDHPILDNGGNCIQSIALLSRWDEPFFAEDCPYYTDGRTPPGMGAESHVRGHLQNAYILNTPGKIKDALMNRGAVYTSFCVDYGRFTEGYKAYYLPPDIPKDKLGWHAVAIAGWDDNYAKENFTIEGLGDSTPPGDGAWLIKNSWGTGWGDDGYFWISYYDDKICDFTSLGIEPADNFRNIYQYDPLGLVSNYSLGDETAWFANVFSSRQTELLKAVSFYAVGGENIYEICVYDDVNGNLIYGPQKGFFENPGYHTVILDKPILFEKGEDLAVAVKLTTPGYGFPIPVEHAKKGYSDNAAALPGQSFISGNGKDWIDTTEIYSTMNVCIKGFTGSMVQDIPGLVDSTYEDLTGTASADSAFENAREVINKTDPSLFGVSGERFNLVELMDYRIISGNLEPGQDGIRLRSRLISSSASGAAKKWVIPMAWNYETSQFDMLSAEGVAGLSPSAVSSAIYIKDGGVYDFPRIADGSLNNIKVMEIVAETDSSQNNSSSGGCNIGLAVPGALLIFIPLLLLKIK